ncbi:MAG TPA: carboxymuconolactone decarboxylase family protein, partial [Mycobacterium sp.]|nr:carboxymuconolactone decarboxylase family protein [Mycobacterium sp.]
MDVRDGLTRLVALSPGDGRVTGLARAVCGRTLGLPPVPAAVAVTRPESDAETVIVEFAEQFSIDVSMIDDEQRAHFLAVLGDQAFGVVVQIYLADYLPRVRAGLEALRVGQNHLDWVYGVGSWDRCSDATDAVFNGFLPAVARMRALDALTSELVRLRGAAQHNCRLCKSLRETTALGAGGSESLYDDVARFEDSMLITDRQKAALRYVDALIWSPARIDRGVAAGVRAHFSAAEAVELT